MKSECCEEVEQRRSYAGIWRLGGCDYFVEAKFHYASWFEAGWSQTGSKLNSITLSGSKLVADRFEAGRRPASNMSATIDM